MTLPPTKGGGEPPFAPAAIAQMWGNVNLP